MIKKDYVTEKIFNEFKDEMYVFRDAVYEMYDRQREDFERHVGALMEEYRHQSGLILEALGVQVDRLDRRIDDSDKEHKALEKRTSRLEAIVL
jgi:hypothetical protein